MHPDYSRTHAASCLTASAPEARTPHLQVARLALHQAQVQRATAQVERQHSLLGIRVALDPVRSSARLSISSTPSTLHAL